MKKLFICLFVAIMATVNVSASGVYVPEKNESGHSDYIRR